jgi:Fe-S-cluster containining protein
VAYQQSNSDPLLQIVTSALASATLRSGPHLVCRPGCSQCCIGVFPIAQQDAHRLRDGLTELTQTDPARAAGIHTRVAASLARLTPWLPGDPTSGILADDHESAILFEEFANDEPCPVLDPVSGTCDLYQHRPILCRTFGPPMRTPGDDGEVNLGTCELCFIHASTEEIAGAELDPTIPDMEAASNETFNAAHNTHGETLLAFALRSILPAEPPLGPVSPPEPQAARSLEPADPDLLP